MSEDRKYVRVYYNDLIRDYPEVWADDAQLATWLRMLATADPMWPTPPELPRSVRPRVLKALADASLVETIAQHRFRMKGMEAERERRSNAARNAAALRWHPNGNANPMPSSSTSTSRDETNADANDDGRADLETFLLLTRRAPTPRQRKLLDDLLSRHDVNGPQWAADIMLQRPDDPIGAIIEADRQWTAMRIEEAKRADKPKPQRRRGRGSMPESARELLAHWAAKAEADEKGAA